MQVACVFAISGACRKKELKGLQTTDVIMEGKLMVVTVHNTKNKTDRRFTVENRFLEIVTKYTKLRKLETTHTEFFVNFQAGKCTVQPIGSNKLGRMPKVIATYLKLPNPSSYTGHSFRRSSTTILADAGATFVAIKSHGGWLSDATPHGYIEDSTQSKRKSSNMIQSQIDLESQKKKQKSCHVGTFSDNQPVSSIQQRQSSDLSMLSVSNSTASMVSASNSNVTLVSARNSFEIDNETRNTDVSLANNESSLNVKASNSKPILNFYNCNVTINRM